MNATTPNPTVDDLAQDNPAIELRVFWGPTLVDLLHFAPDQPITIGEHRRAHVFVSAEALPQEVFPLVRCHEGVVGLCISEAMSGELEVQGRILDLTRPGAETIEDLPGARLIPFPRDGRAVVRYSGLTFALRFVSPPTGVRPAGLERSDPPYLNALVVSGAVHLLAAMTLILHPLETAPLEMETEQRVTLWLDRHENLLPPPAAPPPKAAPTQVPETRPGPRTTTRPAAAPGAQGLAQSPGARGRSVGSPGLAQRFSSLFSDLSSPPAGFVAQAGISQALGQALIGRTSPGQGLLPGSGTRGDIPSGSESFAIGTPRGPRGIQTGTPTGPRIGLGPRPGSPGPRGDLVLGQPMHHDNVSRDAVAAVIRGHRAQVRYCYEKELHRSHDLAGRVVVAWTIDARGRATGVRVTSSTMNHAAVESCLVHRVSSWRFPAPAGGGTATITYPFIFQAG